MGMVERVARAIDKAAQDYIREWHVKCGKDNTLIPYIGMADVPPEVMARAAIEELREPTEEMVDAAYKADMDWGPGGCGDSPDANQKDIWQAMINKAMEDGE